MRSKLAAVSVGLGVFLIVAAALVRFYAYPVLATVPPDYEGVTKLEATGAERDRVRRGNLMARARMIILYDRARATGRLVLGTGNRTEAMTGYTTLHGDAACDLAPLSGCYKREVRALARELGLPLGEVGRELADAVGHGYQLPAVGAACQCFTITCLSSV